MERIRELITMQNTFMDYSNSSPGKHLSISYIFFIIGVIAATVWPCLLVCLFCMLFSWRVLSLIKVHDNILFDYMEFSLLCL